MRLQRGPMLMGVMTVLACTESPVSAPTGATVVTVAPAHATASANAIQASATGGGHYLFQGLYDAKFSFSATQNGTGDASGQFRIAVDFGGTDGTADFDGAVTCMASDPVTGRA